MKYPKTALKHRYATATAWLQQWSYQASLIQLLLETEEVEKAQQQLLQAKAHFNQVNKEQAQTLQHFIQSQLQTAK